MVRALIAVLLLSVARACAAPMITPIPVTFQYRMVSAHSDAQGRIHILFQYGDNSACTVWTHHSFGPVRPVGMRGESLALGRGGRLLVAAQQQGAVLLLYSDDGGCAWKKVSMVAAHAENPRVAADTSGHVAVVWNDTRWQYPGDVSAGDLVMRISQDGGHSFGREINMTKGGVHLCSCCPCALALDAAGRPWILLRSTDRNQKDVWLARPGHPLQRLSHQQWHFEGCPEDPLYLALNGRDVVAAWRRAGEVFVARSHDGAATWSAPRSLGKARIIGAARSVVVTATATTVRWSTEHGGGVVAARNHGILTVAGHSLMYLYSR
ncbi:MAG: sialidase family protein [Candidatus Xenobia bacterium]